MNTDTSSSKYAESKLLLKRKKVSKKKKRAWRKNIDDADVEAYRDKTRLEERIGNPVSERLDEQLFEIHTADDIAKDVSSKKRVKFQKGDKLSLKSFQVLENTSAVPDPVKKRNRIRSKEERQKSLLKKNKQQSLKNGIFKKKELQELKKLFKKRLQKFSGKPKWRVEIKKDIWTEHSDENAQISKFQDWFDETTVRHTISNTTGLKENINYRPKKVNKLLPAIETPHPGVSYNPTFSQHKQLIEKVAEFEKSVEKKEAHLQRVTAPFYHQIPESENQKIWVQEMSQGLPKVADQDETESIVADNEENDFKSINPPVCRDKKKTNKQRKKEQRLREEEIKRKESKEEKKKRLDICRIKRIVKQIEEEEEVTKRRQEKRKQRQEEWLKHPDRVSRYKFVDKEDEFLLPEELSGSLREILPQGSLLKDRFYSMQKRNLIEVMKPQLKSHKRKGKRYAIASCRLTPVEVSAAEAKQRYKSRKLAMF